MQCGDGTNGCTTVSLQKHLVAHLASSGNRALERDTGWATQVMATSAAPDKGMVVGVAVPHRPGGKVSGRRPSRRIVTPGATRPHAWRRPAPLTTLRWKLRRSGEHRERLHHVVVLMLNDVAMVDELLHGPCRCARQV